MDDAKLNNIPLECESLGDNFSKALAKYEFPYRNRALLGDMGMHPRTVRLRCYFWDDGAHKTYEAHKTLIALVNSPIQFELYHPAYGTLKGSVENMSTRHDDRDRTAEIDLEFVEGDVELGPEIVEDVKVKSESNYEAGLESAQTSVSDGAKNILGAESSSILNQVLDPDLPILDQFTGISRIARGYVKTVDAAVRTVEATLISVSTSANSLVSSISFATNLPGRVMSAMANVADRYWRLYDTAESAPDRTIQSFKDGMTALEDSLFPGDDDDAQASMRSAFKTAVALQGGVSMGAAFGEDQDDRRLRQRLENTSRFDSLGNYINVGQMPDVMTMRDVETALYTVREMIQAAVDLDRTNQALKDLARLLLQHVNIIKLDLANIVTVRVDNDLPLHLVCLMNGLPYTAADRILGINNIKNPNYCHGEVNIYNV